MDLFFQDPASTRNPAQSQLLGRVSLLQVLRKRIDGISPDPAAGDPFALESAVATLALSLLKRSSGVQKEFAEQLVKQLSRLAEVSILPLLAPFSVP